MLNFLQLVIWIVIQLSGGHATTQPLDIAATLNWNDQQQLADQLYNQGFTAWWDSVGIACEQDMVAGRFTKVFDGTNYSPDVYELNEFFASDDSPIDLGINCSSEHMVLVRVERVMWLFARDGQGNQYIATLAWPVQD